jgi:hypothetical protein
MTMASTTAPTGAAAPARTKTAAQRKPRARSSAALRDARFRMVQLVLFAAGAVLMPLGIIVISLGWYGTAHSHYDYDQRTYLISGGILGLGLTFVGGFLYFGAWLAKAAADQRDSARQLAEALQVLAEHVVRQPAAARGALDSGAADVAGAAELVFAGEGTTVHRRDCPLIAHRDDLRPITGTEVDPTLCRVCRPTLD